MYTSPIHYNAIKRSATVKNKQETNMQMITWMVREMLVDKVEFFIFIGDRQYQYLRLKSIQEVTIKIY
ncbi:hypothetical protein HERIO_2146 [Hepatospora eriocheir]|uniref:Uncharacterized protein n=1 Tax=Hepatospora eriocheir TaxID=1081669 RepID=A0A1X0Q7X8_9MICR|nr:hypothetical protein HERIO_2146 [Hepatospora eriocheir]